jgi:HEAT repeat protein
MNRLRSALPVAALLSAALVAPAFAGAGHYATSDSGSEQRSESYREGQRALERKDWDEAARIFASLADSGGGETDAALYWKAYADWKLQRKKESLEGLRRLLSSYPESAWADDAKALELEVRGAKAWKVEAKAPKIDANTKVDASVKVEVRTTKSDEDEELKLYALDGLMQVDSDKAVPVLERLLAGDASPRVKERALFVLSQSDSPRAREILLRTARTGQPLDLRCQAVKTLGMAGEPEDIAALRSLAKDASAPIEVREAVIDAYLMSDDSDALLAIARSDPDSRIRAKAIDALGATDALPALRQLWSTEKDPQLRAKLLEAFGIAGDVETLAKAARDADPRIRRKAIEGLGISDDSEAAETLQSLYGKYPDPDDRRKVLEALMIQGDATVLIDLFRAEKDPAMKKAILQQLSMMDDEKATRVILDVLGDKQ